MISSKIFFKGPYSKYLLNYLVTILVVHILLVWIEIGVITDRVNDFTHKFGEDFYDSIKSENQINLRKLLLKGKDEEISSMMLIIPKNITTVQSRISVGSTTTQRLLPGTKKFPLVFSGTNLGEILIVYDYLNISKILISRDFLIYLALATFVLVQALIINFNNLTLMERVRKALIALAANTRSRNDPHWERKGHSEFDSLNNNLPNNVSKSLQIINHDLLQAISLREQHAQAEAQNLLAKQVAHDIRSPLSALTMIAGTLHEIPEEKRLLIKNAVTRINDIANDLQNKNQKNQFTKKKNQSPDNTLASESNNDIVLIHSLIEEVLSEKRALKQFRNIEFDLDTLSFGLFVKGRKQELARLISNLCNNAAEAIDGKSGKIKLALRDYKNTAYLTIEDNGKGIPPEVVAKLGEVGISYGKEGTESGSGLGVYHAMKYISSVGGSLRFQSQVGTGTMVQIHLPKAERPAWFLSELTVSDNTVINILDDDQCIHDLWKERFQNLHIKATLKHFYNSLDFKSELSLAKKATTPNENSSCSLNQWYLIDLELIGDQIDGLQVITDLQLKENTVLVTSLFEEVEVQTRVANLGIKLLPKSLAGKLPISILKNALTEATP